MDRGNGNPAMITRGNDEVLTYKTKIKAGHSLRGLAVILPILMVLFLCIPAQALMLKMSLTDLSNGADTIIRGTVTTAESHWNVNHDNIYTTVTLNVEECLKGTVKPGDQIQVEVAGGRLDDITQWVSDTPTFTVGENTVIFLTTADSGSASLQIYGQFQGKFDVTDGKVGQQSLFEFKNSINTIMAAEKSSSERKTLNNLKTEVLTPDLSTIDTDTLPADGAAVGEVVNESAIAWTSAVSQGFETAIASPWSTTGSPTWGRTTAKTNSGAYSAWCGGSTPTASYPNNMSSWLDYGPFSLAGKTAAKLNYHLWLDSEPGYDYLYVYASTDGVNYSYARQLSGSTGGWIELNDYFSYWPGLGNLLGQPNVWLGFKFYSDSINPVSYQGAFLDDINIYTYTGAVPTSTITSISPSSASAGTESVVTITGTTLGTEEGQVNFFYKTGMPTIIGNIVSWSDTSIQVKVPIGTVNGYSGSAGSGPVTVTNSYGATSAGYPFTVTFSYGGRKWAGTSPVVSYYVNPLGNSAKLTAVQNAADTWTNVPSKQFAFNYGGPSTATTASLNSLNELTWAYVNSTGTIAQSSSWAVAGIISEADIVFNTYFNWSTTTPVTAGMMDVQTIATHELGHWLNLRDLYGNETGYPQDSTKVMFGLSGNGVNKRVLTAEDQAGIQWIYPLNAPTVIGISPSSGPLAGGTSVTISGTDFVSGATVTIGGNAATGVTVDNSTYIRATTPSGTAGAKNVLVTTTGGTGTLTNSYTYVAIPTVAGITPSSGPLGGGTSVTISGTNFVSGATVTIGGNAVTGITVDNSTYIRATTQSGTTGAKNVVVTTAGGTATLTGGFTYVAAPTVTGISPSGPLVGGTSVTISGTNFVSGATVTIGGNAVTGITVDNSTSIRATTPSGTAGAKHVVVTTAGGTATLTGGFTYVAAPTVTGISPSSGPLAGGTNVTITGTGFYGGGPSAAVSAVKLGGIPATGFTVNSNTQITTTAPAGTGIVHVTVTTAGGTSATSSVDQFTYIEGANVNVSVTLQGDGRPDTGWVVPLTVKFFTPGADVLTAIPLYTFNENTAKSGSFAIAQASGVIPGTYDISAVTSTCLTNVKRGVVVTVPSIAVDIGELLAADANNDNYITISDFGVLASAYGRNAGEDGYDAMADFNNDGTISIADFGLLAANYGRSAPIIVP